MMTLKDLVARYLSLAGHFGMPVALAGFALTQEETERVFSAFDEDYHISRFLHFTESGGPPAFSINGEAATHVAIDNEISTIL